MSREICGVCQCVVDSMGCGVTEPPFSYFSDDTAVEVAHDPVNNPAHYKVGGIETIDFIEAKKLGYNLGNVVKYITRSDHKGRRLEDLEKARWYLNREIKNEEKLK